MCQHVKMRHLGTSWPHGCLFVNWRVKAGLGMDSASACTVAGEAKFVRVKSEAIMNSRLQWAAKVVRG